MRTAPILTILLAILLLAVPVNAELIVNKYTNDFAATSMDNEQVKLCSCETRVDRILVENVGQFESGFTVEALSSYPGTILVTPEGFSLPPHHSKEILVYIDGSCGKVGTYQYDVIVRNSYGRIETIHRTIRVDNCQAAAMSVAPEGVETEICKPVEFSVTSTNVGQFTDDFTLSFGPFGYAASAPIPAMRLEPGQSYTQDVTVEFPCEEFGTRIIPITLTAKDGKSSVTLERTVTIENGYSIGFDMPTRIDTCAQSTTEVPIAIENDADASDRVKVDVSGPLFASIGPEEISIPADDERTATLSLSPVFGDVGTHQVTVTATDLIGGITRERTAQVSVERCTDLSIKPLTIERAPITAPIDECCGVTEILVDVRNAGSRDAIVQLVLDGPSAFLIEEPTVRLAPGESRDVPVSVQVPCAEGELSATITAVPLAQPHLNVSTTVTIGSTTLRACHAVDILQDEVSASVTAQEIPIVVTGTGAEGGTYAISLDDPLFEVREEEVTVGPGMSETIHLVPKRPLSESGPGRYVINPTLTLDDPRLEYVESVGVTIRPQSAYARFRDWCTNLPWGGLGACGWSIIVLLIILALLVIALILMYLGVITPWPDGLPRDTLTLVKTLLVIALFVALLALVMVPVPPQSASFERAIGETGSGAIEIYQGTEKAIDLDQLFSDPDKDALTYTATQPRDVRVRIDGSLMTLTPDDGFAGIDAIVVTATDPSGATVDSPLMVIDVIPARKIGKLEFLHLWCPQIIIGLIVAIIVVLFLQVLTIKERRPDAFKRRNVIVVVKREGVPAKTAVRKAPRRVARKTRGVVRKVARRTTVKRRTAKRTPSMEASLRALTATPVRARNLSTVRSGTPLSVERIGGPGGQATVNIAVGQPAAQMVAVPGVRQAEVIYVGAKDGDKVHTPYCMVARRIPKNKRVAYSSKREAMNAGLVPCKLCRPFEGGI